VCVYLKFYKKLKDFSFVTRKKKRKEKIISRNLNKKESGIRFTTRKSLYRGNVISREPNETPIQVKICIFCVAPAPRRKKKSHLSNYLINTQKGSFSRLFVCNNIFISFLRCSNLIYLILIQRAMGIVKKE